MTRPFDPEEVPMGFIRKTAAISTLGLISPRSSREKKRLAEAKLTREQAKAVKAERKAAPKD